MVSGTMQAGMQDGPDNVQPLRTDIIAVQGHDTLSGGGKRRKTKRRKTKGRKTKGRKTKRRKTKRRKTKRRKTKKRRHQTVRKTLSQLGKSLSLSV